MEEKVFPKSAVADLLEPHIVEARLHVENQRDGDKANYERFLQLRADHVGSEALPTYVFLDPDTESQLAFLQLDTNDPDAIAERFIHILEQLRDAKRGE